MHLCFWNANFSFGIRHPICKVISVTWAGLERNNTLLTFSAIIPINSFWILGDKWNTALRWACARARWFRSIGLRSAMSLIGDKKSDSYIAESYEIFYVTSKCQAFVMLNILCDWSLFWANFATCLFICLWCCQVLRLSRYIGILFSVKAKSSLTPLQALNRMLLMSTCDPCFPQKSSNIKKISDPSVSTGHWRTQGGRGRGV